MGGSSDVVAEALEASRIKEVLLSQHARTLGRMAAQVAEAVRAGRAVHLAGDGARAALAAYLADVLLGQGVPARPLGPADDADGLLRAVEAFVQAGDVVLLLLHEGRAGLDRAAQRARARGATCLGLLAEPAAALSACCDHAVAVPTARPRVAAEVFVAAGHLLAGLMVSGAPAVAPARASSSSAARPPLAAAPPPSGVAGSGLGYTPGPSGLGSRVTDLGVIDEDPLASGDDVDDDPTDEASLLAEAVEGSAAPHTDARGLPPRARPLRPAPRPGVAPGLLRFRCGGCEEPIVVEERHAGRRGQCPHCRAEFVIPRPQVDLTSTQRAAVVTRQQQQAHQSQQVQPVRRPSPGRVASPPAAAQASKAERRRAARIVVRDALVRFGKADFPAAGAYHEPFTLEDLSLTGMRFVGRSRDFEVGDLLCFTVDFPAFPEPLRVKGEVRRVMKLKGGGGFAAGVRFLQYQGDAEAKVRRLLDSGPLRGVRRR